SVDGLVGDNPTLEITTPLFDRVVMTFPSVESPDVQRTFEIVAKHNKPSDIYIQSARLNGKPLNSVRFPLKEFFNGGTLELMLGDKPNKKWGLK
ncbi:MAG: glycoside hydrolase family 92 protein, partial [Tannerella sp.]|nr:glycoside hydrolase family 92 protein [Tannerella sp.]